MKDSMNPRNSNRRPIGPVLTALIGCIWLVPISGPAEPLDHGDYDALLKRVVNDRGRVDYDGLIKERATLDAYVGRIGDVARDDFRAWPVNDQKALLINAYNAITLQRIIDHYPPKGSGLIHPKISIRNIRGVWNKIETRVVGEPMTLDYIEKGLLLAIYKDKRIHAAVVCASVGCPDLARDAYTGDRLEMQLEHRAEKFARDPTKSSIDQEGGLVGLSAIFGWYRADFAQYASEVPGPAASRGKKKELAGGLGFLARYGTPEAAKFIREGEYKVKVLKYDWGLNSQ